MALTVTDDLVLFDAADSCAGWLSREVVGCIQTEVFNVEGTNAQGRSCDGPALQGLVSPAKAGGARIDINNTHLVSALATFNVLDTIALGGVRIRVEQGANFAEWFVGDDGVYGERGYQFFAVDGNKPFDRTSGTEPDTTIIDRVGFVFKTITTSGLDGSSMYQDVIRRGSLFTVTGGASTPRGSIEVAANDKTNARGLFRELGGVFYVHGRMIIGDVTASTNSIFEDTNTVWVWRGAHAVAASFMVLEFVGGTGTNRATFGTSSGSGNTKEGSGGNTFFNQGEVPFRIEAIDSDIAVEFFGCSFVNSVTLRNDAVRNFKFEDNSGPTFTDDTRDANDPGTADTPAMPATQAVNDAAYFGHDERFNAINIDLGTAKGGTWTGTWEYSTAAGWTALTDLTDGTANFATVAPQTVTYTIPNDWVLRTVDSASRYWIRFRISSFTSSGTVPNIDEVSVSMGGGVRWEQANAEAIRCTFTNMDTITVRNGSKIKKCIITDSVSPVKSAALDFGSTDPTADTIRDLTIQNNNNGILLQKTAAGDVTYNFRALKFAGNTNDVRVDFPSGSTITINILESGDTPSIQNVNSSTVNILATVNVDVHVQDSAGADIEGAQVYIQRAVVTALKSGAGNIAGDGDLVTDTTIEADQPQTGFLSVFDDSLNETFGYRYTSHDSANTFTFPTSVTGSATSVGTSTTLISTTTNFLTADIEEGDTIRNTTTGGFAVIDEIVDADNIITTVLNTGIWGNTDAFSVHDLATTLISGVDTVDASLFNGQTDVNGDITTFVYDGTQAPTVVTIRVRSNNEATKYIPFVTSSTISTTGLTLNVVMTTDTVAT